MSVTINSDTQFYITDSGSSYHFNYILNTCKELCSQMQKLKAKTSKNVIPEDLDQYITTNASLDSLKGTQTLWDIWGILIKSASKLPLGTFFHHQTDKKVRSILETARKRGQRLRLFYGDVGTGKDWLEEIDVLGTIGRSSGVLKIPLLISDNEDGGPGILDHCIVRVLDADTGKELYRTSNYQLPKFSIKENPSCSEYLDIEYTHSIYVETEKGPTLHANCRSMGAASNLVAFLTGDSMTQPHF